MGTTTIKKNAKGYNYKYSDIAEIHSWLEEMGYTYYQYIERDGEDDYIYTVPIINGEEKAPRRGCKIVIAPFDKKSNPAQEQGSGITYARRYSLLMAFGLATTDDDAQCMTREKVEKVDGEIVKKTPKDKVKKDDDADGYPTNDEMMEIVRKHFPDGSKQQEMLLNSNGLGSIAEMTRAQLIAVYNKFGGR